MADKKKVFSIEINGLSESIDAVKSLNKELDTLQTKIKSLQNAKINIKVQGNTEESVKVQGNKQTADNNALAKLQDQINKETAKNAALVTEEYQKQYQILTSIKESNKDNEKIQKQIAQGVRDANGEYTNTLAGQRAYLSDLKKQLQYIDLSADEWRTVNEEVKRVNDVVSQLEQSHGDFRRNVGNYPSGAKELLKLFEGYKDNIVAAEEELKKLNNELTKIGQGQGADAIKNKMSNLQASINSSREEMEKLNEELSKKIQVNVGDSVRYFDDLKQAAKELQKELETMYAANLSGTKQFNDTITALGKVKTAMANVASETKSYVGNAKGLNDVLSIMRGFTGIASIGQGLMGLFGGQNKELDESLRKFTSLMLVMQGLKEVMASLKNPTDIFGKALNALFDKVTSWTSGLDKLQNKTKAWTDNMDVMRKSVKETGGDLSSLFTKLTNSFGAELNSAPQEFRRAWEKASTAAMSAGKNAFDVLGMSSKEIRKELGEETAQAFNELQKTAENTNMEPVLKQFKDLGKLLKVTSPSLVSTSLKLGTFGVVGKAASVGIWATAKAVQGLSAAIKGLMRATIILAVVQVALEAIAKLFEGLAWVWEKASAESEELVKGFDAIGAAADANRNKVQEFMDEIDRSVSKGTLNSYDALILKQRALSKEAAAAGDAIKQMIGEINKTTPAFKANRDWSNAWFSYDGVKTLEQFRQRYMILARAVSEGVDETKIRGRSWFGEEWWLTAEDAMQDFAKMQKHTIYLLQQEINNIDFSQGEEAYVRFMELINDEVMGSALANIENLFPDEWGKAFKAALDNYKQYAKEVLNIETDMTVERLRIQQKIEDNYAQAINNSYQRANEQRRIQMERELKDAGDNEKLKASIRAKYAQQSNAELLKIRQQAQQAEIDAMEDGLEKQLALLKFQHEQAVQQAIDAGATKETIANINIKWNRDILKAEKDWIEQMGDLWRIHQREIIDFETQLYKQLNDINRKIFDENQELKKELLDFGVGDLSLKLGFELYGIETAEDYKNKLIKYYDEITKASRKAAEERKKIEIETEEELYTREIEDEHRRWTERGQYYEDYLVNQRKSLEDNLQKGLLSQEEYNKEYKDLVLKVQDAHLKEEEAHYKMLEHIDENHKSRMKQNERNYQQEIRDITKTELDNRLKTYQQFYQDVQGLADRNTKSNTSDLGVLNYKKEKENLTNLKNNFKEVLDNLYGEYINLQKAFDNKQLSFDDFNDAKRELDGLVLEIKERAKETDKELKNLFQTSANSVGQLVNKYMQAFSQMWNMVSDLLTAQLDGEEERLEHEQDLLDKEYDMFEEQYNRQEELVKKHTDNINSIEDELKNARGDRRKFLIDQLAKQQAAQQKALETEINIQKQKEENQKKQEQLEKEQDILQKKRWELNKKNSLVTATVNTAMAVTNALSLQPFWLGIAMAAVASALGTAQIAMIASQKYYRDGGLLNGPSHENGGMRVGMSNMEVEGGEYVINKKTTNKNLPLLNYINSKRRPITKEDLLTFYDDGKQSLISRKLTNKFADGGQLPATPNFDFRDLVNYIQPQDDRPLVVSVVDIINATENVRAVETLSGLSGNGRI